MKICKMKAAVLWAIVLVMVCYSKAMSAETPSSPNGRVLLKPAMKAGNIVSFSLCYKGNGVGEQAVMALTAFGVQTEDGGGRKLMLRNVSAPRKVKESYAMQAGKRLQCENEANEVTYTFVDTLGREQCMTVRLYNDGIAFRYELSGLCNTLIGEELTTYDIKE